MTAIEWAAVMWLGGVALIAALCAGRWLWHVGDAGRHRRFVLRKAKEAGTLTGLVYARRGVAAILFRTSDGESVERAKVWITRDRDGDDVFAGPVTTGADGQAIFDVAPATVSSNLRQLRRGPLACHPDGAAAALNGPTLYRWAEKPGLDFLNPKPFKVVDAESEFGPEWRPVAVHAGWPVRRRPWKGKR